MKLRFLDNKLLADDGPGSQDPGPQAAAVRQRQSEAPVFLNAAGRHAAPILDIPTLQSGQTRTPKRCSLSRTSRRLYSRVVLGLKLPGRYYFITWTSSPDSPPIEKSWPGLRKFLKRYRPGSSHCYCITSEGDHKKIKNPGVIHMIMRLGKNEERMDVRKLRSHWQKLHKATQLKIKHVPQSQKANLAAYLSDQRKLKSLGGEMAWQDGIVRWHWSTGWLPKGFTRAFGRTWAHWMSVPSEVRDMAIKTWLNACHLDNEKVKNPPRMMNPCKMNKREHRCTIEGSEILTSNMSNQAVADEQ